MKKQIALLMAVIAIISVFAGCGKKTAEQDATTQNTTNTTATTTEQTEQQPDTTAPESAVKLLESVWALYGDDEKFFVVGGDENNAVSDAPGVYDVANTESLMFGLLVPEGNVGAIKEAANLVHAMNSNVFSAAAFRLTDDADVKTFADGMRDAIQYNQWMCGFPEKLLIATVGDKFVVTAYGQEPMGTFEAKLKEAYPAAEILYNEVVN